MPKIRVTKIFEFDTAHALHNYDGLCANIHGHTYKLYVTAIGEPMTNQDSPKCGMVVDFGILKNSIKQNVIDQFDHSVVISKKEDINFVNSNACLFKRVHIVDFQPTAENLVAHFAKLIEPLMPAGVELFSLRLYETSSSFAEWFKSDQNY